MNMMLKRQLELKKKNGKKGFTLIEVIVVIVILAILAAIAVPNLTGYIEKAKTRAVIADARNAEIAITTLINDKVGNSSATLPTTPATWVTAVNDLAGTKFDAANFTTVTLNATSTRLDTFIFTSNGWKITYTDASGWGEPEVAS
jgi:type IV pilus assembly protein PilA